MIGAWDRMQSIPPVPDGTLIAMIPWGYGPESLPPNGPADLWVGIVRGSMLHQFNGNVLSMNWGWWYTVLPLPQHRVPGS